MLLPPSTSLTAIVAKTVRSCLPSDPVLLYNWDDKLRELVVGICLSRSLVLQSIAQTRPERVKTTENVLSAFLGQQRLDLSQSQRSCVVGSLKRMTRRRFWRHNGKFVLIIDSTAYAKARSRRKIRPMPGKGKVRVHNLPTNETLLVPGYQEIWVGVLMKDRTVLPLTRRLWSENGPACASMNMAELVEIGKAKQIIRSAFGCDVILVADSGFRRKELLCWLKRVEKMDYVIRIEGKLTVGEGKSTGLLANIAPWWRKRARVQWRERSKRVLMSDVSAHRVSVETESKESFSFNAVYLEPITQDKEPMFLATTLTTETTDDLRAIVRHYSWRWGIETFFWKFKEAFRADSWRVFSCWEAIDHLLSAAHMAYLVLVLLAMFCMQARAPGMRRLLRRMKEVLQSRFARPPELTLGRFFRLIAMDFPSPRQAKGTL